MYAMTHLILLLHRDNVSPKVQGVRRAIFSKVDTLEDGEDRIRKAIERGEAKQV